MKICFKCGAGKPLTEFYKHPQMGDGYLGKCKACTRKDVQENRDQNIERYRAYDRKRGNRQDKEDQRKRRNEHPEKAKAHRMIAYHTRAGHMTKKPCEVCGAVDRVHGHHDDYSKPLDVVWLCVVHHHARHKALRLPF